MITLFLLFFLIFTRPIFAESISTPSATLITPQVTPTITLTPTPTPIINPATNIYINELMPYSSIEWIEIFNKNDMDIELINWKIRNKASTIKLIPNLKISANNYAVFNFDHFFNKEEDGIVYLINQDNQIIDKREYFKGKYLPQKTWSLINNSWCLAEETYNKLNGGSCYEPTPTIKPTETPTPTPNNLLTPNVNPNDRNLYKLDESATASAIFTPTEESSFFITPAPTIKATPISSNLVLGKTTTKKNYLPLLFIVLGGLLLISPTLIAKFKKK